MNHVADDARDGRGMASRQPLGAFSDGLEHRLHVGGRAGDDPQDFGGRGLPLQRLLAFLEQACVLDGNDGLVGEALLKRKLLGRERLKAVAMHNESADRLALAPKRRAGDRAGARRPRRWQPGPVGDCGIDIVDIGM